MKELKEIYNKISRQTQNRLHEIFDSINFTFENMYNIADNKSKKRINTYIEEWRDRGLLVGYFGVLANNIYKRSKVKNSEILELLIYGAYIEEQSKLEETELNIFKDVANYYYQQGQEEVNSTLPRNKKKIVSVIPDAIFLAMLDLPNSKGYIWKQYIEAIIKFNADQICRQATIDIQQKKEPKIDSDVYQNIIKKQQNTRLCINNDKISGAVDNELIGINNQAKIEGIKNIDKDAQVQFVAIEDQVTTKMCHSLNGQKFNINGLNEFTRYSEDSKSSKKYSCKGLVIGLNLPPINDHYHYCRSTIIYLQTLENKEITEYNTVNYIRKNKFTNNKGLDSEIKRAIKLLPKHIQKLIKNTKILITDRDSYYDRKADTIYLLKDANKYEIIHEIGHAIETKLDILHDNKYIEIQKKGLETINPITDTMKIKGYGENDFIIDTGKFISEYQRRVYEEDIDKNGILDYSTFVFNTKTLGEYFSEGFRCYFESNKLLKKKDIDLYNYIKEMLK